MDDAVLHQIVQQHGIDVLWQNHSDPSSPSLLQSLPVHASFDHGCHLTIRAIQELRDRKNGSVSVGIGGPSGSGKSSLARRIASVLGGAVIAMEHYHDPTFVADDTNDLDIIDFSLLIQNLEGLLRGNDVRMPQFDFQQKKRTGCKLVEAPKSGVVVVEGTYALNSKLRSYLDIRVAVVGGVHFSLLSKVRRDIGESLSLDYLTDSIFPMFRKHIEPDLHHAQIRISNSFKSSLREPYYILKMEKQFLKKPIDSSNSQIHHEQSIEMHLRPPLATDYAKTSDWIRMRQCGIRYDLGWGDQRIVDKNFIIKPKVEFEVGKTTLGGLLAVGYQVAMSYKRKSEIIDQGRICVSIERLDDLEKTFVLIKGTDRKVVATEALSLGMEGPWITKSYLEMLLEKKGPPRLGSPPLPSSAFQGSTSPTFLSAADKGIISPGPMLRPLTPLKMPDASEPWTRSPRKSEMEPVTASWHLKTSTGSGRGKITPGESSPINVVCATQVDDDFKGKIELLPMAEAFDFDRGLLLAVQGVQTLLNAKGPPVIVGIGGPSGSGKTSLAHKMANIVGCEVISLESYYKPEQVKDFKYDDFSSLDLTLLLKNIQELRALCTTMIPLFDFEKNVRSGFKAVEVSKDCGVVIIEGVYALHPDICNSLDIWIAVIGGVHSHLVARVQRDLERSGRPISPQEVMTTVFPMFQQYIEPHLVHAHLKIRNDFDPVHSPDSSMFVLKSSKQIPLQDIAKVLNSEGITTTVQHFTDIYLHLPNIPSNGLFTESSCIRVRHCEGRFALLIREPIREGNFIIQPKVDFDISVRTVAGLLNLGYQAVAYLEATATIYHDEKLLIEVDYLKSIDSPYIQIKGSNKEAVAAAGLALNLEGSYTTMPYIEIILGNKFTRIGGFVGLHDPEAAQLRKWVDFVQSQGGSSGSDDIASTIVPMEYLLEELQIRVRRLERWQMINSVLWTFFMSAFVGYVLYQQNRRSHP